MAQTRSVGRVSVRVMPDTSRFKKDLETSLNRLERALTVNIPVALNSKQLREQAVAAKREAERHLGELQIKADANTTAATRQLDQAARDRTAEITPEVDRSALARVRRQLASLARIGGRGLGMAAGGSVAAGGLAAVAGGAAVAAGQVVQLAAALAPLAGLLGTLPAAAGGAVAALATLRVATAGVGDAFSAAFGDAEEFEAALENLAPAAQQVAREFRTLAPALSELQQATQQAFFAPMRGALEEMGQRLLPVVARGMVDVGDALGGATAELMSFAGSAQSVSFLDGLFDSTATAIRNANSALPNFLSGLFSIGQVGLPYLEDLGAAIDGLAARWATWAADVAASGQLTEWIDQAIATFQQLGDIISNVGGILGSVFGAAGDGGILTTIETLTAALNDFFASAEGQDALIGLFEGLASIGSALSPVITALASGIGALAPAIGRIAEAIGPVLTRAVEGLVPALQALEPGITAVITALGKGVDALVSSGALEQLGNAFSDILIALSPLMPLLGELAATILTMLADLLVAIAPSLELLATALVDALAPVLPDLAEAFSDLVEAIAPLLPQLIDALLPILPLLPDLIRLIASQMSFWAQVLTDLTPLIELLIDVVKWVIEVAAGLVSWVLQVVATFWQWVTTVRQSSDQIQQRVRELKDKVIQFVQNIKDRGVQLFTDFKNAVSDRVQSAVDTVKGVPDKIKNAFSNAKNWLLSAGRNVIQGLIDGIQGKIQALRNKLSGIASEVRSYWPFSPAKQGPLRRYPMDEAGRNIAQMLADGIAEGERLVARASERLAGAAAADLSANWELAAGRGSGSGDAGGRAVVQVTNYYPQAEPTSTTTNRALQYAAAIGVV